MTYNKLLEQVIDILLNVKANIKEDSDCIWTYYESTLDMYKEIDKYVTALENGNTEFLDEINMHFLPTAAYQEHSMQNGWTKIYLKLASDFDIAYASLKNYS